ncbi:nuclease [Pseudomonas putida S11]|nr:nuclease [Pseudomonas putida S11]
MAVRQVVDGDTLRLVDGRSVRLIGINAPEIGRNGRTSEPYAEAARQRLQALVKASDGRVGLEPGVESKDKYGRTLAHIYGRNGEQYRSTAAQRGLGLSRRGCPPMCASALASSLPSRLRARLAPGCGVVRRWCVQGTSGSRVSRSLRAASKAWSATVAGSG